MAEQLTAHVWVGDGDDGSCVAWRDTATGAFATPTFLGEEIGHELAQALLASRHVNERLRDQLRRAEAQAAIYRQAIEYAIGMLTAMPLSSSYSDRVRDRLIRALASGQDPTAR